MQLYSATVRLSGSLFNEVRLADITAPEIIVLQRIHGGDAIRGIANTGSVERTDEAERERLKETYAFGVARVENTKTLEAIFGPPGVALPQYVPGIDNLPAPKGGKRAPKETPVEPVEPIKEDEFA